MRFSRAAVSFFLWSAQHHSQPVRAFATAAAPFSSAITSGRKKKQECPAFVTPFRGGALYSQQQQSTSQKSMSTTSSTALHSAVATSEAETTPVEYFRKDYQPLPFTVDTVNLEFDIYPGKTTVTAEMKLVQNPNCNTSNDQPLELDGDETAVKLISIQLDGQELKPHTDYTLSPGKLILLKPTDGGILTTTVEIVPEDNTQLSGLYKSGPMYCTQCEAQGFRRITYFPDRPDNMSTYASVTLKAPKDEYPVLLSNGNLVEQGTLEDNNTRHYAVWSDPFPKPSYLFAAVAGNLASIHDSYTTASGQDVQLAIFSEKESVDKLQYAMDSLKRSMKWDEDRFGLEYDLGIYNIVATSDFNMGAMENKVRTMKL